MRFVPESGGVSVTLPINNGSCSELIISANRRLCDIFCNSLHFCNNKGPADVGAIIGSHQIHPVRNPKM